MANLTVAGREKDEVRLTLVETTDVHGNFFPYNFITRRNWEGSMARVCSFVDSLRNIRGKDNVILLDNGDILQGQPSAYYYNFIDTAAVHPASRIYDFMGYDAVTIGNHDVETGRDVYSRWIAQTNVPVLGANVVDVSSGKPWLKPYVIINRGGVKIAVLGLLTPAIPAWLPENLWKGLTFKDMVSEAELWVSEIKKHEKPDAIVGLFHSGADYTRITDGMMENASVYIAENVPGFDVVFFGHDHQVCCRELTNVAGEKVWVLNPANNAVNVAVAELVFASGKLKMVNGEIVSMTDYEPSEKFLSEFSAEFEAVRKFVDRQIGYNSKRLSTQEAYFGASEFMQLLHELQLEISGADVSFAAPLSFNASIEAGPLRVADMFTLYKYENLLYSMRMSGREIKNYLEKAYSLWCDDAVDGVPVHLLKFQDDNPTAQNNRLKNPSYNFDSAYGIDYTVDVTRDSGDRVRIDGFSDGRAFDLDSVYTVAVNSYRGNGGGHLLTEGAGIDRKDLKGRIVKATDKDLRYYLLQKIEKKGNVDVKFRRNWKFVPEDVARSLAEKDSLLLFGEGASQIQK